MLPAITGKFFLKHCLVQANNDYKPVFLIVMGGDSKPKNSYPNLQHTDAANWIT